MRNIRFLRVFITCSLLCPVVGARPTNAGLIIYDVDVTRWQVPIVEYNNFGGLFTDITVSGSASAGVIPEPSSLAIFGIGALGMLGMGIRCRKKQGQKTAANKLRIDSR